MNKALRVLLITNSLVIVAGAMLGPIYAILVEEIGGDLLDASVASASYAGVAAIVIIISGRFADKMKDPELMVVLGYIILGLGFLSYTLVNSVSTLLIAQAIIGLGEALALPAFDGIYSDHLTGGKAATQWGAWEAMSYVTYVLGALIGGVIATQFGFPTLFIIMGSMAILSAIIIAIEPRELL